MNFLERRFIHINFACRMAASLTPVWVMVEGLQKAIPVRVPSDYLVGDRKDNCFGKLEVGGLSEVNAYYWKGTCVEVGNDMVVDNLVKLRFVLKTRNIRSF